jgi:predicted Rossmann fold flavoprotein
LKISSYWREGQTISIDLLPSLDADSYLKERKRTRPRAELANILAEILPARLAHALAADTPKVSIANLSNDALSAIAQKLKNWRLTPTGSEGWGKAEVTVGGVDTAALSSKTMEASEVPGLYLIGEAVDVTGWLGGYNFQWAWSSGWCAGRAV